MNAWRKLVPRYLDAGKQKRKRQARIRRIPPEVAAPASFRRALSGIAASIGWLAEQSKKDTKAKTKNVLLPSLPTRSHLHDPRRARWEE